MDARKCTSSTTKEAGRVWEAATVSRSTSRSASEAPALLEERDPELYDAIQLQCHATLSALLQEHDPERVQISKF